MSKVKITGDASGTGTFTLAAPNSNTDRTFTLPDASGDLLTSGSAGVGKILQVVSNQVDTIATYVIDSEIPDSTQQIAALDTSITPTASDSKILLTFSFCGEGHFNNVFRLFRGSTEIGRTTQSTAQWAGFKPANYDTDVGSTPNNYHFVYVDEPATTSAVTYNIRVSESNNEDTFFKLNRAYSSLDVGLAGYELGTSQVILMEIGA
jgi:hypothetical protein